MNYPDDEVMTWRCLLAARRYASFMRDILLKAPTPMHDKPTPSPPDELIEALAIRCARGNNGGEWAIHYNDDQKNFWRAFVRDIIEAAK